MGGWPVSYLASTQLRSWTWVYQEQIQAEDSGLEPLCQTDRSGISRNTRGKQNDIFRSNRANHLLVLQFRIPGLSKMERWIWAGYYPHDVKHNSFSTYAECYSLLWGKSPPLCECLLNCSHFDPGASVRRGEKGEKTSVRSTWSCSILPRSFRPFPPQKVESYISCALHNPLYIFGQVTDSRKKDTRSCTKQRVIFFPVLFPCKFKLICDVRVRGTIWRGGKYFFCNC